ncbi:hypothetical protein LDENG_00007140 [Lucifuga dentata]|nr:hypothetical protein LDENG_00007140 [Lucifuga dentata]
MAKSTSSVLLCPPLSSSLLSVSLGEGEAAEPSVGQVKRQSFSEQSEHLCFTFPPHPGVHSIHPNPGHL